MFLLIFRGIFTLNIRGNMGERWRHILTLNIPLNIGVNMPKYHAKYVKEHYVKRDIRRDLYERFIEWCGERSINICLEKALNILASNMAPNIGANIAPNTGAGKPKPATGTSEGYEWCRPRSSIRSLQGFLEWADSRFGLLDWWEEDGKVCLRTRRKPAKTE
jgi:GNAT superfamily N-acetyltransferase